MAVRRDEKFIQYWGKVFQKGKLRFMITRGLFYGIMLFLFVTLIDLTDHTFAEAYLSQKALLKLILYILGSMLLTAPFEWWANKKHYEKMTKNDAP
jgi:hypothetical protein